MKIDQHDVDYIEEFSTKHDTFVQINFTKFARRFVKWSKYADMQTIW